MNFPAFYGILLTAVCGCTLICNMYATRGNYKTPINRLFTALGLCLAIWSVGSAVALAALTQAVSLAGRRIASVGWGLAPGFLLHYAVLLTGEEKLLAKKRLCALLYLPGIATVAAFSVLPLFGLNEDRPVRTNLGWVGTAAGPWHVFLCCYAAVFLLCTAVLLARWGKSGAKDADSQARILLLAVGLFAVLEICLDGIPRIFHRTAPQISALFTLPPIFATAYCVEHYGLMRESSAAGDEIILKDSRRKDFYRYLSIACLLGGTAAALARNLFAAGSERRLTLLFALLLILFGIYTRLVSRVKRDEALKETLVAAVLTVLIPAATWWLTISVRGALWAVIFPLIILCLLFNRKIILTTVIFMSILTQALLFAMQPATVRADGWSYLIRALLICAAGGLSYYVNRVYMQRLRENSAYMESRALIARISKGFISVNADNFDALFQDMLRQCSLHIRCDKSFGILMDADGESVDYFRACPPAGTDTSSEEFKRGFAEIRAFFARQFRSKSMYVLTDTEKLTEAQAALKKNLLSKGVKSAVCLPIKREGDLVGFLAFGSSRPIRQWNLHALSSLEIIANTVADAVAKLHAEREIRFIAYHDQLTGLPNRLLFREALTQALRAAEKDGTMVGVVFLDLDSFKSVNDTLGHDMGDRLLAEVAKKITTTVGGRNTVSRFGGDEFVLLLTGLAGPEEVPPVLQKLIDLIHRPVFLNGQEFFVTSSAGAAMFPFDGKDADSLIRYADMAMYAAKKLGKDRYALCSPAIKEKELEQVKLTNLLYRAQERDQLLLYYQPQVNVITHAIVGMEALLRWNLPGRDGLVSPAVFIPLAEKTGLIQPIGEWVLRQACLQGQKWRGMGLPSIRMAVNVSLLQLRNPDFCTVVATALEQSGLPAGLLELEITESVANSCLDNMAEILARLKALGVKLSIDDFGTEYSSLGRLRKLPVDSLKMDIQFVRGIEGNERDKAITKVIITLAKSLNLRLTAEGVETKPELDFLSQRMCDEVQGYYYYRPMPVEEAEQVLRAGV